MLARSCPSQNPFTQVFLPFAVVVVMFALGTTLTFADLRRVLVRPRAFVFGVAAHALLLPLLAFAVGRALRLPGPLAVGLVLIASCPANAAANLFTLLARGDTMLSICLTAAASLTSVFTVPLFVNAALGAFATSHHPLRLPVLPAALGLFLVSTLPVLLGMRLRARRPDIARAVEARIGVLGLAVVAAVVVGAVWSEKDNVLPGPGPGRWGRPAAQRPERLPGLGPVGPPGPEPRAAHRGGLRVRAAELRHGHLRRPDPHARRGAARPRHRLRAHHVALRLRGGPPHNPEPVAGRYTRVMKLPLVASGLVAAAAVLGGTLAPAQTVEITPMGGYRFGGSFALTTVTR